jgi:hypothetical protein
MSNSTRTLRILALAVVLSVPAVLTAAPAGADPQPPATTPINCTSLPGTGVPCPTPDPTTPYGGLDHYLCYFATSDPFTTPQVTVQDQFGTLGPLQPQTADSTATPPTTNWFCTPFQKTLFDHTDGTLVGPVYDVTNPRAHLVCYNDTGSAPGTQVTVTNQLGSGTLVVGSPTRLCLPSWKFDDAANPSNDLAAAGSVPTNQWSDPSNLALNHFQCYKVSLASDSSNNFNAKAFKPHDQFDDFPSITVGQTLVPTQVRPVPDELCAPAIKTVVDAGGHGLTPPSEINGDGFNGTHLLCFPYSDLEFNVPNTLPPLVQAGNQFSQSPVAGTPGAVPSAVTVDLEAHSGFPVADVCFPSFKAVLPQPTTPEVSNVLLFPLASAAIGAAAWLVLLRRRQRVALRTRKLPSC